MTRSEAAKICQSIKFILENSDYTEEVEEALDMAIAALKQLSLPKIIIRQGEQEPTAEYSSDVISRQAAIDVVRQYCTDNQIEDGDYHANGIEYELNELPSAQPFTKKQIQTMQELEAAQVEKAYELGKADRPIGHWIETEHSTNENGFKKWIEIRCPFCGHEPVYENIDDMEFCPKCGANMTGGEK